MKNKINKLYNFLFGYYQMTIIPATCLAQLLYFVRFFGQGDINGANDGYLSSFLFLLVIMSIEDGYKALRNIFSK